MVDLTDRLKEVREMVDAEKYFTINRARQYGKTTLLTALAEYLKEDYEVISLDFQGISYADFASEQNFVAAFSRQLLMCCENMPEDINREFEYYAYNKAGEVTLSALFILLAKMCRGTGKKIVLLIDEVDSASNNQVFIDFLAGLRQYYLMRRKISTFQSVILTGVYDVRYVKQKIRPDAEHKVNSPWNTREGNEPSESLLSFGDCPRDQMMCTSFDIAADFNVDMHFSAGDISGMLEEYEKDYRTGMDIEELSGLIYDYTSGYPYLVSRLCKFMDEEIAGTENYPDRSSAWTKKGFLEAIKLLINDNNTLFQSLTGKLEDYPMLRTVLYELLFTGKQIPYVPQNQYIEVAAMFGFIKNRGGTAVIANRIFETVLYNLFISEEFATSKMYDAGAREGSQFIVGGHLNVRRVLEKFVETFDDLYGDGDESFLEDAGRRYFMLFLKPIINGVGNSYVEAETRGRERMDLVIDYRGEQSVIEMKVWRGNAYHERGEEQLSEYLDHFHLKKGYMLSFNFNKKKEVGVKEIVLGDKLLIEATV